MQSDDADACAASSSRVQDRSETGKRIPLVTLIRHPETTANQAHVLQGATDSPLTVNGQQQAARLANAVAESLKAPANDWDAERIGWDLVASRGSVMRARTVMQSSPLVQHGQPPSHLWSSPAGRARTLAGAIEQAMAEPWGEHLAHHPAPKLCVRSGLAERCFGQSEGRAYSRASSKSATAFVDPAELVGLQAESHQAFHQRVEAEADHVLATLQNSDDDSGLPVHIVIVTHGLWIRTFLDIALARSVNSRIQQPFTQNTGLFTLGLLDRDAYTQAGLAIPNGISARGRFGLVSQNDTTHLKGLKRQRGGIGSSASDKRQQTLKQVWQAAKPKPTATAAAISAQAVESSPQRLTSPLPTKASPSSPVAKRGQQTLTMMWKRAAPYKR